MNYSPPPSQGHMSHGLLSAPSSPNNKSAALNSLGIMCFFMPLGGYLCLEPWGPFIQERTFFILEISASPGDVLPPHSPPC